MLRSYTHSTVRQHWLQSLSARSHRFKFLISLYFFIVSYFHFVFSYYVCLVNLAYSVLCQCGRLRVQRRNTKRSRDPIILKMHSFAFPFFRRAYPILYIYIHIYTYYIISTYVIYVLCFCVLYRRYIQQRMYRRTSRHSVRISRAFEYNDLLTAQPLSQYTRFYYCCYHIDPVSLYCDDDSRYTVLFESRINYAQPVRALIYAHTRGIYTTKYYILLYRLSLPAALPSI